MAPLVVFLLAVWGCAYVISESKAGAVIRVLARPIPGLRDLVRCGSCLAFWIGAGLAGSGAFNTAAWFSSGVRGASPWETAARCLVLGFAGAGFVRWISPGATPVPDPATPST